MEDPDEDIAIVGIGCSFPGGEGLENFWKVLSEGKNCVVEISEERFDVRHWYDPDDSKAGKSRSARAALIDRFNQFDNKFFSITDSEADYMDPQQKLLLECSYRALENAGIPMEKASGTRTGVFLGLMNRDYETLLNNSPGTITHYNSTGTAMSVAANRISYTFNLTGPSFAIDSACSSSLVALHSACQAIRQRDCDMALCGGISCIIEPRVFVALSKAKMISPEGTSKPFSDHADGYGRGEGCGVVVLKPLSKAMKDFDHVWGIVCKTAVNQDGRSVSPITKPSMVQQEELLRRIYSAEIDPLQVQYVEAHGTGTRVGDPIEAKSISNVIAQARPPGSTPLLVGSVKGNIGHTESAAGMAGLIKVLLMMHHKAIVPSLFYSEECSSINAKVLNLKIPTQTETWEENGPVGRTAGVSSFGFGGTNAHAVVRQYTQMYPSKPAIRKTPVLFVLSASSEKSLVTACADTYQQLIRYKSVDLQTLAYTSACRRSHVHHKYRKGFMVSSLSHLQAELKSCLNRKFTPVNSDPQLAFVFCGNGVTYRGMCGQLLKKEPIFRAKVKQIEKHFNEYRSLSIVEKLECGSDEDDIDYFKPDIVQPLLFAVQVALVSLLKHWGIKPAAVLGHSVGEVAAAHCSGLLSLEDAVKVIYFRSTLQSQVTGGKMLVVSNMVVSDVLKFLPGFSGKVWLAALNSPQSCTLSGDEDAVDSLCQKLKTLCNSRSLFLHTLNVPAAYHSPMMDPILAKIENSIGILQDNEMEADLFSSVTGTIFSQGDFTTGSYWARNIREPVAFEQAVKSLAEGKKNIVFIEISPRRALHRNIIETLGKDTPVFSSVQPDMDLEAVFSLMYSLFELGVQVNWEQFYKECEASPTPFPTYQFDYQYKKVHFEAIRRGNEVTRQSHHPLIMQASHARDELIYDLSSDAMLYVWEHAHNGTAVVPGALYVELALASYMASVGIKPLCSLQLNIAFQNLFLLEEKSPPIKVKLESETGETKFTIYSPAATNASGVIRCTSDPAAVEEKRIVLESVFRRCDSTITTEQVYLLLSQAGFQYGPTFKCLGNVQYGEDLREAVSIINVSEEVLKQMHEYCIHPVLLDCFLQMSAVVGNSGLSLRSAFPSAIGCMTVSRPLLDEMVLYLRITIKTADYFEICGCFTDKEGHVLIELRNVRITFVGKASCFDKEYFFHNEAQVASEPESLNSRLKALVFEDNLGVAKSLKNHLHPSSAFISCTEFHKWLNPPLHDACSTFSLTDNVWDFDDVLFMCGIEDLSPLKTEKVLERLVDCCEIYRQIVLMTKKGLCCHTVRVVTYRSAEANVDHISSGFVLSGMTRSCAAEIPDVSFQLIDLASVSREDIRALVNVIYSYHSSKYPEVMVKRGQIYCNVITPNAFKTNACLEKKVSTLESKSFILHTGDPYRVTNLSAIPCSDLDKQVYEQTVEVQLDRVCVHSSDFFPVSDSDLTFGRTMYWNKHTFQKHRLLALDFNGTVVAVGKDVTKLKVGDHVASCYPIVASSTVVLPEAACYKTKKLPFLRRVPCTSYFVLSWEILNRTLPKAKQNEKMGIVSSDPHSSLLQIMVYTAEKSGWNTIVGTKFSELVDDVQQCEALVVLPPLDPILGTKTFFVSKVKHVVVICDNKASSSPINTIRTDHGNIYIENVELANILQKSNLRRLKIKIYRWLKSMFLDQESLHLPAITFQRAASEGSSAPDGSESYFSSKTMPVIVLDNGTNGIVSDIPVFVSPKQLFQKNSVYIVTGGLSGLGIETVKFIAQRGGGCIATLSRRGLSPETHLEINSLQNRYDVSIICLSCDVSVSEEVVTAITAIEQRFPSSPIRGVFHSAVVLHDGLIETLDKSAFEKVFRPKISGVLNLHYATMDCKLDFFVCYSSISSFIGNATQTNYAAANSFLDMFCHYRRNCGLAGQSINWGPLNLGLLWNRDHLQRFLEAKGMVVMDAPEFHASLECCLLMNKAQQVVCSFNFRCLRSHMLSQNASLNARLSALVEQELKHTQVLEARSQEQVFSFSPEKLIRSVLSETCTIDPGELSDDTGLSALGIDSMLAMTLQNKIFQESGVKVPLVKLLDPQSTVSTLFSIVKVEKMHLCGK